MVMTNETKNWTKFAIFGPFYLSLAIFWISSASQKFCQTHDYALIANQKSMY